MLVQTFCYVFVVFGCFVSGLKTGKSPGSSVKTYSQSQSSASYSYSSSSSSSSSETSVEDRCSANSTYTKCLNPCPKTCGKPDGSPVCTKNCLAAGCECDPGYVLSDNGKCVYLEDCPDYLRCNDANATFTDCPSNCPRTCALPGSRPCIASCAKPGCVCKEGFYQNDDLKCVALQDCPGAAQCSSNETFVFCKAGCPTNNCPKDDNRGIVACSPPFPCGSGCSCKNDYLRSDDGRCILYSDCPPINCTRPNEIYSARPPSCLFESCTDIGKSNECNRNYPSRPQCICKPGFYRNKDGVCVPEDQCFQCGANSSYKTCPNPCPKTCGKPDGAAVCTKNCLAAGCECDPGYVLSDTGECVKLEECPDNLRCNDANATFSDCPSNCPRTCAFPGDVTCIDSCAEEGCVCNERFYLNDDKKCVALQDCPGAAQCSSNETFVFCNAGCPTDYCPTDDIRAEIACSPPEPCGSGCSCKKDHLRSADGRCISYLDCPPINCTRPNEIYSARPPPCIFESCNDIGKLNECDRNYPSLPQCICEPGFYRNKDDICVPEDQCFECGSNSTYTTCRSACPKTCEKPDGASVCILICLEPGCECDPGYVLTDDGQCVKLEDCPAKPELPTCGRNEIAVKCKTICPPQSCEISYIDYLCTESPCVPGCDCLPNHLRNELGECIPNEECPPPQVMPECGENEIPSVCKIKCPPQSCASIYTLYNCIEKQTCEWGCDCKDGFLRNFNNECIPSEECPTNPPELCGFKEVYSDCAIACPPQTCESIFSSYMCSNETVCKSGCDCLDGYLRNLSGICVPSEECFLDQQCDISPECKPTCDNPEPNCLQDNLPSNVVENQDGCKCKPGFILSQTDGNCIRVEECPDVGCNGDPNSMVTSCPWPCPSTCEDPKASLGGYKCDQVGCQCKTGFLISDIDGSCVQPCQCKNGNPCGSNATFSECSFSCPNQYCPEDDSRQKVACKPGRPCPSGCNCNPYYLKKSYDDDSCILASDCPPVTCTRPNEVWDPCASECLAENCDDLTTKSECYADPQNCQPQCVCIDGHYRNGSGICVPKDECPGQCEVQQECRPTCAVPNPENCQYIPPATTNIDSCNCQADYILSEAGGKCIKIEECPTNQSCNGDPNAFVKQCPLPCPSTCESPNATPCKRMCFPIGCECKPGYLKSENGSCILPNHCKGGNPCGVNETFAACRFQCPTNYCPPDDSRAVVVCETFPFAPCFSGCSCKLNYRLKSREDPRCIVSSECPRVNCTRPNEKWNSCPSSCNSEYCDAVDAPRSICNTLVLNCNPKCECKKGYFRNDKDICVSSAECRKLNKEKELETNS